MPHSFVSSPRPLRRLAIGGLAILATLAPPTFAEDTLPTIDSLLVVSRAGRSVRGPLFTDAIEARLVAGTFSAPSEGDTLTSADGGELEWRRVEPNDDGRFRERELRGGYAYASVESDRSRVVLLDASGHRHVYVNGTPRGGDVYALGYLRLPIDLREGRNDLLFRGGRGSLTIRMEEPPAPCFLETRDRVLPDLVRGESEPIVLGIPVTNATREMAEDLVLELAWGDDTKASRQAVAPIVPIRTRRVALIVPAPEIDDETPDKITANLRLLDAGGEVLSTDSFELAVREPSAKHRRTFVSTIDGSVQYYAVTPRRPAAADEERDAPAMFLSLHGASVEATNQAYSYSPKDSGYVVAPTNRRPFGFDWEDWGRLDALEVLRLAERRFETDPNRTYLTGHSMGGHGTWNLGAHQADRFAAIAPSAGWRDFWSYGGAAAWDDPSPVEALLERAANASRTLLLENNFAGRGVYVLHGDADRNVPVSQARFMRERLAAFHTNFAYYERPGAGHWWGNQCMDWPPLVAFLEANHRPADADVRTIDFTTVNPGIAAARHWITIEGQDRSMLPSRVEATLDAKARSFTIETTNVTRLTIELDELAEPRTRQDGDTTVDEPPLAADSSLSVTIDDLELADLEWPRDERIRLRRDDDGTWTALPSNAPALRKTPLRSGPFKDAFRHRMVFVYGTVGTEQENAWAFTKARFDAETFQYRGNGSIDLVADTAFDADAEPDRGVILFGNADTNRAWAALLADSPIDVRRDAARVGDRAIEGADVACLFLRPRPGSNVACVGVVAGTGLAGMRLTNQIPYFVSGAGFPDWTVLDSTMLERESAGVVGCGFFDDAWRLADRDSAWRDE